MKQAVFAVDPGDEIMNWLVAGSDGNIQRYGEGNMIEFEEALLEANQHYVTKAGMVVVIEDYISYPGNAKLYKPLLTAENLGVAKYICDREQIPYVLQKAGEMKLFGDDYLRLKGLWVKNRHYRSCLKHYLVYKKKEAAGHAPKGI